jgi:hypothetical protein
MRRLFFKWDWRRWLFQPHLLIISQAGAVLIDKNFSNPQQFSNAAECLVRLKTMSARQRPVRIFLDAVEHNFICQELPPLSFWDRARVMRHHLRSYEAEGKMVFHSSHKPHALNGLMVEVTDSLKQWLEILDENQIAIEGIYSLPFEICCLTKDIQMLVLQTVFKEIRFIFTDSQGGMFCRFLPSKFEATVEQQISMTLQYVCRQFHLSLQEITVLSSYPCAGLQAHVKQWQQLQVGPGGAENFLLSLIKFQGNRPFRQQYAKMQRNWWNYLWPRLFIPASVALSLVISGLSLKNLWDINIHQQEIMQLQESIQSLQAQVDIKDIVALERNLVEKQKRLECFTDYHMRRLQPLIILRKLLPLEAEGLLQITQLSLSRIDAPKHVRLLLECKIRDSQVLPEDSELYLRNYAQFLATQFPKAKLKVENHNEVAGVAEAEDFNSSSYHMTIQLEDIQP